jgi:hypothetical protein
MDDTGDNGEVGALFTKWSHHKVLTVICVVQNLFHKGKQSMTMSLNANYIVLLRNQKRQATNSYTR